MKLFAWALYEFAATLFSMNVLSRYFALWVKEGLGASDQHTEYTALILAIFIEEAVSLAFTA
jgi:MFS-type transporter involved in bile tolerance (Atg22 family)